MDKVLPSVPVDVIVVGVNAANAGRGAVLVVMPVAVGTVADVVASVGVCCWWGNGCANVKRVLGVTCCAAGGMTTSISDERYEFSLDSDRTDDRTVSTDAADLDRCRCFCCCFEESCCCFEEDEG